MIKEPFGRILGWTKRFVKNESDHDYVKVKIAKWAELATSQNNHWMTATRLHDADQFEEAMLHYLADARCCLGNSEYEKAALSLSLAGDCLASSGRIPLAIDLFQLARRCYLRLSGSPGIEASWARIKAASLYEIVENWNMTQAINSPDLGLRMISSDTIVGKTPIGSMES